MTIRPEAWILAGSMLRLLVALLPTLRAALRSRRDLVIENLALRQQLATLASRRHPAIATSPTPPTSDEAARTARRTIEALSLLVMAYAKPETMHPEPHTQYDDLRNYWGHFLDTLLGKVKGVV